MKTYLFKPLAFLNFAALAMILCISCAKEYSYENPLIYTSVGTLKSAAGDCLPVTVNGSYTTGTPVNDSNYIDVEVVVSKIGTYLLISDKNNGVQFRGEGVFIAPGGHIVRLTAMGIPAIDGQYPFTITFGKSHCNLIVLMN